MAATSGDMCVGLSVAQVATLPERWPMAHVRKPSGLSLSACAVATPSSIPSTATPSDVGSLHDEPLHSEDFVASVEPADFDDCMLSPSKSFRRRLRRKRQAEAIKASAEEVRPCLSSTVTLEDIGFGIDSPCRGFVDATQPIQSAAHSRFEPPHRSPLNTATTPSAYQANISTGHINAALPMPLDHFLSPISPCKSPWMPSSMVFSTSPCNGTVVRGDASARTPVGAVGPVTCLSHVIAAANLAPIPMHPAAVTLPTQSATVSPPSETMRFLCGGQGLVSAEDMAQRLRAAAPEVYED